MIILLLFSLLSTAFSDEVCYGGLGCFDNTGAWAGRGLPQAPEDVAPRFLLFTRSVPTEWEIVFNHTSLLQGSDFDSSRARTIVVIHGFADNCYQPWTVATVKALLQAEDANVFCVDWPFGSRKYSEARDNARLVGAMGAQMMTWLGETAGLKTSQIYLIGHDIGAHAASYLSRGLGGVARVTGLDPASLDFDSADNAVRLDSGDAALVDFVVTNAAGERALGLGSTEDRAMLHFRPNGGESQPGCHDTISSHIHQLSDLRDLKLSPADWLSAACSHFRSTDLYIESISSGCGFVSLPCSSYKSLQDGTCPTACSSHQCQTLGYHAADHYHNNGTFFLETSDASPFCDAFDRLEVTIGASQKETYGQLTGAILDKDGSAQMATLTDGRMDGYDIFHAQYITAAPGVNLVQAQLLYVRQSAIFHDYSKTLVLDRVQVTLLAGDLKSRTLVATDITLQTGVARTVVLQAS